MPNETFPVSSLSLIGCAKGIGTLSQSRCVHTAHYQDISSRNCQQGLQIHYAERDLSLHLHRPLQRIEQNNQWRDCNLDYSSALLHLHRVPQKTRQNHAQTTISSSGQYKPHDHDKINSHKFLSNINKDYSDRLPGHNNKVEMRTCTAEECEERSAHVMLCEPLQVGIRIP